MKKILILFATFLCLLLVLTSCANDQVCQHEWGEWTVVTEPTCETVGTQTRVCTLCDHTQTEEISQQHLLGEWIGAVSPTCTQNGVKAHYKCTRCKKYFDKSNKEIDDIAILASHSFENGVCTVCGVRTGCDHEKLHLVTMNLADYGACGGLLVYESCDCGSVKTMGEKFSQVHFMLSMANCNLVVLDDLSAYKCQDCGLVFSCEGTIIQNGCEFSQNCERLSYSIDNNLIVDGISFDFHSKLCPSSILAPLPIEDWGACTPTSNAFNMSGVFVDKCPDCECYKINTPYMGEFCNISNPTESTGIDEQGREYVKKSTEICHDCGLRYVYEEYTTQYQAYVCASLTEYRYAVYRGDEVVFEVTNNDSAVWTFVHDEDCEYEVLGESCKDGLNVVVTCKNCDYEEKYTTYGCLSEEIRYDLSNYTACGGYIDAMFCEICGDFNGFSDIYLSHIMSPHDRWENMGINCVFGNAQIENTVTDDIEHKISTFVCINCGMEFITDEWTVERSECINDYYIRCSIRKEDQIIINERIKYSIAFHNYEVTQSTMQGTTCDEGWEAIYTCLICDDTREWFGSGHKYDERYVDISAYGTCDDGLLVSYCIICDEIKGFDYAEVVETEYGVFYQHCDSNCRWISQENVENGEAVVRCEICSATKKTIETRSERFNCTYIITEKSGYYSSTGACIFEYERTYEEENHDVKYQYIANGTDCEEDGYTVIATCFNCGKKIDIWQQSGHRIESEIVYEYGRWDLVEVLTCAVCDYTHYVVCWGLSWDEVDKGDDGWYTYRINEYAAAVDESLKLLQMKKKIEYSTKDQDCSCTRITTCVFYVDGEEKFRFVDREAVVNHDYDIYYTLTGETCNEGECYKTCVCRDCEYRYTEECYAQYEERLWESRELTEYGVTDGAIKIYGCVCGEYKYVALEGDYEAHGLRYIDSLETILDIYEFENGLVVAKGYICDSNGVAYLSVLVGFNVTTGEYEEQIKCEIKEYPIYTVEEICDLAEYGATDGRIVVYGVRDAKGGGTYLSYFYEGSYEWINFLSPSVAKFDGDLLVAVEFGTETIRFHIGYDLETGECVKTLVCSLFPLPDEGNGN